MAKDILDRILKGYKNADKGLKKKGKAVTVNDLSDKKMFNKKTFGRKLF